MSNYVIAPHPQPSVPVAGSGDQFPVRRIFCVGRNYGEHAKEMGFSEKEPPFFFTKPADAIAKNGATIPYPPITNDLHHEIEMVIAIGKEGANIPAEQAMEHIWGAGVGIDFTRRDQQITHREKGRPWCWGKAFDNSAPMTSLQPLSALPDSQKTLDNGQIWLRVNGEMRQQADLSDMIWNVRDIIAFCSQSVTLKAGDLIMTGTPAGVGAVTAGDVLEGGVENIGELKVTLS